VRNLFDSIRLSLDTMVDTLPRSFMTIKPRLPARATRDGAARSGGALSEVDRVPADNLLNPCPREDRVSRGGI